MLRGSIFLALIASVLLLTQAVSQAPHANVTSATSQIIPPSPQYRFPDGKTYNFSIEWHLFTAGTASVTVDALGQERHITASGDSKGFVNTFYKVHDRFESVFDPHTFCSTRVSKHTEEGSRRRETEIRFDYSQRKSALDEKNLKTGEVKHLLNDIPGCVSDVVSGFFYVPSLPLEPGNVYNFPINDGKTADINLRVEAREQVNVPAGTFQTVRVRAEASTGPLKGKGAVWVWYTDDANRTPVQMRSKLGWGSLTFRLQKIEERRSGSSTVSTTAPSRAATP